MLTLFFLQTSRAIRTAWLLEELNVEYELKFAERRSDGSVPPDLGVPTSFGKAPAIQEGSFILCESGAIAKYICEKYDIHHRLLPTDPVESARIREFMWASEGNFMLHIEALLSARSAAPASAAQEIASKLVKPIQHDLDWLEKRLSESQTKYLVGNQVTTADTMMIFPVLLTFSLSLAQRASDGPELISGCKMWRLEKCTNEP